MLTWREREILVFDENLLILHTRRLPNTIREGWGLCNYNNQSVIISDGSDTVFMLDIENFQVKRMIKVVNQGGGSVRGLNELEIYRGMLMANIYLTPQVALINLESGKLILYLQFDGLVSEVYNLVDGKNYEMNGYCLNGIIYDASQDYLYVTGKNWPILFKLKI